MVIVHLGRRRTPLRVIARSWPALALVGVLAAGVPVVTPREASADRPRSVDLGAAENFAVLAGAAVNNAGNTLIDGDLGVSPGTSVTGFPPGRVRGTIHRNTATAIAAKTQAVDIYNQLKGRTPTATVPAQLGGTTRTAGVYNSPGDAFEINGTLTLDAQRDPSAVFIFQANTLATARVANIALVGGAQESNVFWQIGDSAALGTYSTFRGTILALNSVSVAGGTTLHGRAFALNGNVAIESTTTTPFFATVVLPDAVPTTTTLTASPNPSPAGRPVTFTAVVKAVTGTVVPQGDVVFQDGETDLGTGRLDDAGAATFTTSGLAPGQHQISAVYLGGSTAVYEAWVPFGPSTSATLTQTITG
ncbi:hypothetical protein GCM10022226_17960 [Sphaerisporangium flaviroseum]|uniref:Bacterial Ig-like domain-containing protein n=1 Tax=Sphaerisporangium flaviroseum TaxID=509199 RepID=A0ABP7HR09_9ACTN